MRLAKTIAVSLFLGLACLAQVPYHESLAWRAQQWKSAPPSGFVDPSGWTNLGFWLHAGDLTSEGPVSLWTNRIPSGGNAIQPTADAQPRYTNGLGVMFFKTNILSLTNAISITVTNCWAIISSVRVYDNLNHQRILDANVSGARLLSVYSTLEWRIAANAVGDPSEPPVGKLWLILHEYDFGAYTNNILSRTALYGAQTVTLTNIGAIGGATPSQGFQGNIMDIFIWTNVDVSMPPQYRTNLWLWATNTYPSIL